MNHLGRFLELLLAICFLPGWLQAADTPMPAEWKESLAQRDARMQWWREAKYGLFIHWGVYSVPAGEWEGVDKYGEWIMDSAKIPVSRYEKFRDQFNPEKFDAKQWVQLAKDAGMRYIVITSKHHDGFCMFDTKQTNWSIMATPWKRDPLKELAEECKKAGIQFGVYYSVMDWHHPDWGVAHRPYNDLATGKPNMDRYVQYMKAQLKELIENYQPSLLWFDGTWEGGWKYEQGADLDAYCRSLKPDIIINNRIGAFGDYHTPENVIPLDRPGRRDWETCMSMNSHWGYCKADHHWKSTEILLRNLVNIAAKGGNFLLNVGPTAEGVIPEPSVERLRAIGDWLKINGESIYGASPSPLVQTPPWGFMTRKPGKVYLHLIRWPQDGRLTVPGFALKPRKAFLLDGGRPLQVEVRNGCMSISVPEKAPDKIAAVIVLDVDAEACALADAVDWLETYAECTIRASKRTIKDGTGAFPPQVGKGYEAFWLRDYEYALEGSIDSFLHRELIQACQLFLRKLRADGAGVDCVKFDGTPIYQPGYGTMGVNPVADGSQFTVGVAWQTYRKTKAPRPLPRNKQFLDEVADPLIRAMQAVPRNPEMHLVHIKPGAEWDRCPYGFTDTVRKQGDVLFSSLLYVQAGRQLAELLGELGRSKDSDYWKAESETAADGIRKTFWDPDVGLFRAATVRCKEHDIWGSAFAVYLGVADDLQAKAIAEYFKSHYAEIVLHGYIRQLPGGTYWEQGCGRDTYQNGGFWAVPTGWFVYTLNLADPELADRTVLDMATHFQQHGACEWITAATRRLPHYLASAALPLDGIRAMRKSRESLLPSQTSKGNIVPVPQQKP